MKAYRYFFLEPEPVKNGLAPQHWSCLDEKHEYGRFFGAEWTCFRESVQQAGLQAQVDGWAGERVGGDTLYPHPLAHPPEVAGDVVEVA